MQHSQLVEMVGSLEEAVGPGAALEALRLSEPGARGQSVSEYDSRLRLAAFLQGQEGRAPKELDEVARATLDAADAFLWKFREERLRQARWSFNVAMALVALGTITVLGGVVLLYRGTIGGAALTAAVGAISGIGGQFLFKFSREANRGLEKVTMARDKLVEVRRGLAPRQAPPT